MLAAVASPSPCWGLARPGPTSPVKWSGGAWPSPPSCCTDGVTCWQARKALCILGVDYLRRGYFKGPKRHNWWFGIAALETEEIRQLNTFPGPSEDPSVGLLRVKEQQVLIAITTVHCQQCHTKDYVTHIHEMIHELESQGVVSKTHSPYNSPIGPVRKSSGEWRLTVDYRGLNKVTPPLSAAVPDMLEIQYELESKAAKWCHL
ncbi:hypothetical protein DUI87_30951 [Hirundo rustica rustica]|uniref:Reverse transcriptase domain-containing protein n=1 Tax=Hirundo rustica rustica TaxID=333673 RepID=A0A3M0IVY5_HIRRU|nr:hypothetical protein DUI87_30951 [Hirundo rustica rustica]